MITDNKFQNNGIQKSNYDQGNIAWGCPITNFIFDEECRN